MLHRYYHIYLTIARGINILLLAVICGLLLVFVMGKAAVEIKHLSGGVGVIDMQFIYSPNEVMTMLQAYGEKGRSLYIMVEATAGVISPLVYAMLLSMLIINWFHKLQVDIKAIEKLLCLPLFAFICDYLENILIIIMLYTYPEVSIVVSSFAAMFTALKWLLILASVLVCVVGAVALALNCPSPDFNRKGF